MRLGKILMLICWDNMQHTCARVNNACFKSAFDNKNEVLLKTLAPNVLFTDVKFKVTVSLFFEIASDMIENLKKFSDVVSHILNIHSCVPIMHYVFFATDQIVETEIDVRWMTMLCSGPSKTDFKHASLDFCNFAVHIGRSQAIY